MTTRILLICLTFLNLLLCQQGLAQNFLIVANGPFEEEIVKKHKSTMTIIALDGAAANLYKAKIIPNYILGDFDSLDESYFNFKEAKKHFSTKPLPHDHSLNFEKYTTIWNTHPINYVRAANQNYTDLEKGIRFCENRGARNIALSCALGGERTDHSLGNLAILKKHHKKPYRIWLETQKEIIEFLKNKTTHFTAHKGKKVGLFGFPKARVTSQGLMWEMNDHLMKLGENQSLGNIMQNNKATITVRGEAILIRPNF